MWIDCAPPKTADKLSKVVLAILLSICCAVRVDPPVWTWNRHNWDFTLSILNLFLIILAQTILAALNFATSSKKSRWALKKNDTCSVSWIRSRLSSLAFSKYVIALANVNASSWTAVLPASRMWYPDIEILFHLERFCWQNSKIFEVNLSECSTGKIKVPRAIYSLRISF